MNSSFYCNLNALTVKQRERHGELSRKLHCFVIEFRELPNGYSAELESPRVIESEIEEFLILEKLCCPFFTLKLEKKKGKENRNKDQKYNIEITGDGEIKPFIRAEFGIPATRNAT